MKSVTACLVLCLLGCGTLVKSTNSEDDERMTEQYKEKFRHAFQATSEDSSVSVSDLGTVGVVDFHCEMTADEPKTIHGLSPMFVDVVAAMGDSVTAGFGAGARNIIEDVIEYRGLSWSIGGDKNLTEVATLPNVIRKFNKELDGFSIKTGLPNSANAGLNVAVSGAVCRNMLSQAETLVEKLEAREDMDSAWKVITMWIGGNDFCAIRDDGKSPQELAERYVAEVKEALDYIHQNVPRAFVNIAAMINVSSLSEVKGFMCSIVHASACKSITTNFLRGKVTETYQRYNDGLKKLIDSKIYERDDFTVVLQPFFSKTQVPHKTDGTADKSYFAPDCFHFSQKGHAMGAIYLWNNMFEPLDNKTTQVDWHNMQKLTCPVLFPYFRTYANSHETGVGLLNANSDDDHSSTNLTAILVGTGVGVFVVAMVTIVVAVGVIRAKRLNRARGERVHLLTFKH